MRSHAIRWFPCPYALSGPGLFSRVDRNVQTKFGVIYAKYEARFFYYEVTLVLRRTIFVLIATLMQQNTREQILASTLMLTFIWVAHVKCNVAHRCLRCSCTLLEGVDCANAFFFQASHTSRTVSTHLTTFCCAVYWSLRFARPYGPPCTATPSQSVAQLNDSLYAEIE